MEEWKDVLGYENLYEVSNIGRIRNKTTKKIFKGCKDKDGYLITTLRKNGIKKTEKIHRLVAESFLFNPNNYPVVNHKDENKQNNNVENLEWCDIKYNNSYSKSKLLGQFNEKFELIKVWKNANIAQKELKIWANNIRNCCRGNITKAGGYIWKYIEV